MHFKDKLISGFVIKRYKRFFCDVRLEDGTIVTAHVPNTGSMKTCLEENWPCLTSFTDDPKRKLKYTLEMTNNGSSWIGVNTGRANQIVKESLIAKSIPELLHYDEVIPEYTIGESRLDFCLKSKGQEELTFVEVKSVTMSAGNLSVFPDAVTTRGQKHIDELIQLKKQGHRTVLFFLIQREDTNKVSIAKDIDPVYAAKLGQAMSEGVEVVCYKTHLNEYENTLSTSMEFGL